MGYGLGLGLISGCLGTWEWKRVDKEWSRERDFETTHWHAGLGQRWRPNPKDRQLRRNESIISWREYMLFVRDN
jgi:hypothetical protein